VCCGGWVPEIGRFRSTSLRLFRTMHLDLVVDCWREGLLSPAIRCVVRTVEICSNFRSQYEYLQELRRQELPSTMDVKATIVYTHVLNVAVGGVRSPPDRLRKAVSMQNKT